MLLYCVHSFLKIFQPAIKGAAVRAGVVSTDDNNGHALGVRELTLQL